MSANLNRREFLIGSGSLACAGAWAPTLHAAGYPSYYEAPLAQVASRVTKLAASCDVGFWFVTDLHIKSNARKSGLLLAELAQRTPLADVLCGGDLVEAFGKAYPTDRDAVDYAIDGYRTDWVRPIRAAGGRLYTARGNHDFTVCHAYDTPESRKHGFTYDGATSRKLVVGEFTERDVVTNEADPEACYYYRDDARARVRYVVADTTDTQTPGDVAWGVAYGMHETQLVWLAEKALMPVPKGWSIVVMHHIPLTGVVGSEGDYKTFAPFRQLLEAYQNRTSCTLFGRSYDFASAQGTVLIDLTGHHHAERMTFQRGILHATMPCDAWYRDYITGSKPWCDFPLKTRGTYFEQTFDAVQFDRAHHLAHFTRVGGGANTAVHLHAVAAKVGTTLRLTPTVVQGACAWGAYDADFVDFKPDPSSRWTKLVEYRQTKATVSPDGEIKILKAGEIVVNAIDKNKNKEIFAITAS